MADVEPGILDGLDADNPIGMPAVKKKKKRSPSKKKVPVHVFVPAAEVTDEEYLVLLREMNTSEVVALVRASGLRGNRAVPRPVLYEMILSGRQQDLEEDQLPVERMRDAVQGFLDGHPLAGTNPKVCPRNCYMHPDLYVLHCFARMRDQIVVAKKLEEAQRARKEVRSRAQPRLEDTIKGDVNDVDDHA